MCMKVIEELGIDNLKIIQNDELYRFTSDAVMLSKFADAKKDDLEQSQYEELKALIK